MKFLSDMRAELPWLASGFLLMMFSGFGQTYYIALFAGNLKTELTLSDGQFGGLYTLGTLLSAGLLTWAGRLADTMTIRWLGISVMIGLAVTCLLMAGVSSAWMLALVVFGLRFFGQGMCTHTALTAMGRWFNRKRGRAVSMAGLGLPASEGLMPLLAVSVVALIGWRGTWIAAAGLLLLVGVPAFAWLLKHERHPTRGPASIEEHFEAPERRHWSRAQVLRHPIFYALMPGVLASPFIITAVFFNQVTLVEVKGWQLDWFARSFTLLAGLHVVSSLLAGWMVDRFGARRILFVFLFTLAVATLLLAMVQSWSALLLVMSLYGVTMGFSGTASGALWAELYGTVHLGAMRSVTTAFVVLATAIAPGVVGLLLDAGVSIETQLLVMGGYSLLAGVWTVLLIPRLNRLIEV